MSSWPLNFALPWDEMEEAQLDGQIGALEEERRRVLSRPSLPEALPPARMRQDQVWLAAGLAALGSLFGAKTAPSSLARHLGASQARLEFERARKERTRQEEAAWSLREALREAEAIDDEIARRSRLQDQARQDRRLREETSARARLAREGDEREAAWRKADLELKKSQADADREKWQASEARLLEAAKLRQEAEEARRSLAEERLRLEREKAAGARAQGEARLRIEESKAETQRERLLNPGSSSRTLHSQSSSGRAGGRSSGLDTEERLQRLVDQKSDLVRDLRQMKISAENGTKSRYFTFRRLWWRDGDNVLRSRKLPEPTASGKAALRRLKEIDERILDLRSHLSSGSQPFDPSLIGAAPPPSWAKGPIQLRPASAPAKRPSGPQGTKTKS